VGDSLDELREAKAALDRHGVVIRQVRDHEVSQSIYLDDPDGNMVELFVDADPAIWAANPAAVAQSRPLALG
jgi:catechol 2,3-dioxygenase